MEKLVWAIFFILLLVVVFYAVNQNFSHHHLAQIGGVWQPPARTKTAGCRALNALPEYACTPGELIASATREQICVPGYSSSVRNVTEAEKKDVYAEYGIASHLPGEYEVDHLISLELGGSNDIANLWPEAAEPRPGYHEKDAVENYLHKQVCDGALSLSRAQEMIASDWQAVYKIF